MKSAIKRIASEIASVLIAFTLVFVNSLTVRAASFVPRDSLPSNARSTMTQYIPGTGANQNPYTLYNNGNCLWYAFGRAWEILGYRPANLIFQGNANAWFGGNKSNYDNGRGGFAYSTNPYAAKLGALVCFNNASGGHVAVVEEIRSDGTLRTSNSGYGYQYYYNNIEYPNKAGFGNSRYTFQGYIYLGDYSGAIGVSSQSHKITVMFYSNYADKSFSNPLNAVGANKNVCVRKTTYYSNVSMPDGLYDYTSPSNQTYLARTGYTATGKWNTKPDGSGYSIDQAKAFSSGQAFAKACGLDASSKDVTVNLYAQWKKNPTTTKATTTKQTTKSSSSHKITVMFYSNYADKSFSNPLNAVGANKNVCVRKTTYYSNVSMPDGLYDYTSPSNLTYLARTGYTATGKWNTKPDGSGYSIDQAKSFSSGQAFAKACGLDASSQDVTVKLYAQWKKNSTTTNTTTKVTTTKATTAKVITTRATTTKATTTRATTTRATTSEFDLTLRDNVSLPDIDSLFGTTASATKYYSSAKNTTKQQTSNNSYSSENYTFAYNSTAEYRSNYEEESTLNRNVQNLMDKMFNTPEESEEYESESESDYYQYSDGEGEYIENESNYEYDDYEEYPDENYYEEDYSDDTIMEELSENEQSGRESNNVLGAVGIVSGAAVIIAVAAMILLRKKKNF